MKKDEIYTKIMNQLEIIHAENMAIYHTLLIKSGVDSDKVDELMDKWDKRFQDERKEW